MPITTGPSISSARWIVGAIYTVVETESGAEFLAFLIVLVARYVGRKILLVCDNARFHTTMAVQQWLAEHRDQIEVFGLPPYSRSLNLIQRLWGHIKRTVLANVLYASLDELVAAFRRGVGYLTGNRSRMSFMFDHDEVNQGTSRKTHRQAAWRLLRVYLVGGKP
jgi:transposase